MINSVTIAGYLGKDPEVLTSNAGLAISRFTIAINEVHGKGADRRERTHWIDCTAFGTVAEAVERFLSKGSKVTVVGRLHQNRWETSSGQKMSKLTVIAENVAFMSKSSTNNSDKTTPETTDEDSATTIAD